MKLHLYSAIFLLLALCTLCYASTENINKKEDPKIKVLIIDGQSVNHKHWKEWTPVLMKQLDDSGLFYSDVLTAPPHADEIEGFLPKFEDYDVIISLYDGPPWSPKAQKSFIKYISKGGGLVIVHAADNSFPDWPEYNEMIGLGGWGNRDETDGPYVYINDQGERTRDETPGKGGHHGKKHEFQLITRNNRHPIMRDIPDEWMHAEDELYEKLRGPARNLDIMATAYSSEEFGGSGRHEPIIFTVHYGEGRIFHTVLGHDKIALSCVGFTTTFVRGCEWAATDKVTFPIPEDFPGKENTSTRAY